MEVGQLVTAAGLKKAFGSHAPDVLREYLEFIPPEKKGERKKWKVVKELPSQAEFEKMRIAKFTVSVDSLVCDAYAEFESLKDELGDWHENLPENLQGSQKADDLQSAVDALDQLQQPDLPEFVQKLETVFYPTEGGSSSRSDRREEAISMLQTAVDFLNEEIEEQDDDGKEKWSEDQRDEMQSAIDDLENAIGEAEGVEFPGMY